MSETNYADVESGKQPKDSTVMHILYGMHTVAPFTFWTLAVIALVVNYIKRSDETDSLHVSHHSYMIRTFWWSILWLVVTGPLWLLLVLPGAIAWTVVGLWYLYRCIVGWLRFNDGRAAP
jgi:uncharacterized membrane protein